MSAPRSHTSPWHWITRLALGLLLAIVITRFTTEEFTRDVWDVVPGGMAAARAPGAATGLVLDLLSALPLLAILLRASLDPQFQLRHRWSHLPMFALGFWAIASVAWSSDKFLAAVTASHLLAGFCLLWATSQLVRSWLHLRIVAAVCFGLLLVLVAQSVAYRAIDSAENIRYWNEHKESILKEHGWQPGSFVAQQFEHKVLGEELAGFFNSPNTFAAVGVLLFFVSAGLGIQKLKDGDSRRWLTLPLIAAGSAIWIIIEAKSKTAAATPLLGILMLAAVTKLRPKIQKHPTHFYWLGVAAVVGAILAVVGHGLYHGGLFPGHFSNSLDFRWKYWIASARLFAQHPIIGVGWSNFGLHYVSVRLASASEEIKDPHNFLVRFFVELGSIGGLLAIAWQLRLWWELTQSPKTETETKSENLSVIAIACYVAVAATILSVLTNVDFTQSAADITLEVLRRLLYLLVLVLGMVGSLMLSPQTRNPDIRPAPWLRYCILIALGLFLIHNLIDFSIFEFGPMFVTFLLFGSALGVVGAKQSQNPSRGFRVAALLFGLLIWATLAAAFVFPIISAEQFAYEGNESIRSAPTDHPPTIQMHYAIAAELFHNALENVPYNADYALRCAEARLGAGDFTNAQTMILTAQQLNPRLIDAYLLQANVELQKPNPSPSIIRSDFEKVLQLDPNDVSIHTQYGDALDRLGLSTAAAAQYQQALACNAALPPDEPKRISPQQIADLQAKIRLVRGRG
jgi:cytochrome c-type biogenesis protein CcmH/NrfG